MIAWGCSAVGTTLIALSVFFPPLLLVGFGFILAAGIFKMVELGYKAYRSHKSNPKHDAGLTTHGIFPKSQSKALNGKHPCDVPNQLVDYKYRTA